MLVAAIWAEASSRRHPRIVDRLPRRRRHCAPRRRFAGTGGVEARTPLGVDLPQLHVEALPRHPGYLTQDEARGSAADGVLHACHAVEQARSDRESLLEIDPWPVRRMTSA